MLLITVKNNNNIRFVIINYNNIIITLDALFR